MRIIHLAILLSLFMNATYAQELKIFYEKEEQGYVIYATNPDLMPISVVFEFDLKNMKFSENKGKVFVISPKAEKQKIGIISLDDPASKSKFSYKFRTTHGDVTKVNYEKNYAYDLPFEKGKSFNVFQGYNGSVSHQNENSLDFTMPEGTKILAAREGVVVKVIQNNTESCPRKECEKYNNVITIMHSDGSYATYAHIKYNGAQVQPGDSVKKSQLIALSGNVGYSSGPHLHFICYLPNFEKRTSLETFFSVDKGDRKEILKEGKTYSRNY